MALHLVCNDVRAHLVRSGNLSGSGVIQQTSDQPGATSVAAYEFADTERNRAVRTSCPFNLTTGQQHKCTCALPFPTD